MRIIVPEDMFTAPMGRQVKGMLAGRKKGYPQHQTQVQLNIDEKIKQDHIRSVAN